MTAAKISAKLPDSNGLTKRLAHELYGMRAKGEPIENLVVVGLLSTIGHAEKDGNASVMLEFARLEVVSEKHARQNIRDLISQAHEDRHGSIPTLPLDFPDRSDADQVAFLVTAIEEWAQENGHTDDDVSAMVLDYFGGPEYVTAEWRKAPVLKLREFGLTKGALADDGSPLTADGSGEARDESDDDGDEPDDAAEPDTDTDDQGDANVVAFSSK